MIIRVEQYGTGPDWRQDAVLAVRRALKQCAGAESPATLLFPRGIYHFRPDKACEKQVFITNHDQKGLIGIAFPLDGLRDPTIDGQGSTFIFHGGIVPFMLDGCSNATLRNFSIDWERPMFEQGVFVRSSAESFDIRLHNPDYELTGNRLTVDFDGRREAVWGIHELDSGTLAHACGSADRLSWGEFATFRLEEIERGVIRFSGELKHVPRPGNAAVMRIGRREHPGIFLKDVDGCLIESVNVYHAPGMALVAQRSADIHLREFNVMLKPESDRWVSATADATHFANCRGTIVMERCLFENQLDDAANVHGIYAQIAERVADDTLLVRLMHEMHPGVEIAGAGDKLRFVDAASLLPYAEAEVTFVEALNSRYVLLSFGSPLPDRITIGDAVENLTWAPDFTVRDCLLRANRARGLLISTPGKVLVERNTISAPGAGIKISGDANSWYESGAVRDVTIRGNIFSECNSCSPDWGKAAIDIDPEIERFGENAECYHRNIRIEDNEFVTLLPAIVAGHSVDGFVFRRNTIRSGESYRGESRGPYAIELKAGKNLEITENSVTNGGTIDVHLA